MRTSRLMGKLLRVPRLLWDGRFDTVARTLAVERAIRLVGVGRTYRIARWIGFRRLAGWALEHRLSADDPELRAERRAEGAKPRAGEAKKKAA